MIYEKKRLERRFSEPLLRCYALVNYCFAIFPDSEIVLYTIIVPR